MTGGPLTPRETVAGLRTEAEWAVNRGDHRLAAFLSHAAAILDAAVAVAAADGELDAAEERFGDGCLGDFRAEREATEGIERLRQARTDALARYRSVQEGRQ